MLPKDSTAEFSVLEMLEPRIAPASINGGVIISDGSHPSNTEYQGNTNLLDGPKLGFINATEARFKEADGDIVSIKFSEPILTEATWKLIISGPGAGEGSQPGIDLTKAPVDPKLLRGLDISVSKFDPSTEGPDAIVGTRPGEGAILTPKVVPHRAADVSHADGTPHTLAVSATSDGLVNLAFINAAGIDLGDVAVAGNLGKIIAGDSKLGTAGLESLTVESLGTLDEAGPLDGTALTSTITGSLKKLSVAHDINGALLYLLGGKKADLLDAFVGGDVLGGGFKYSGGIFAEGTIQSLSIEGDIVGGSAERSGFIHGGDGIKSLVVGGDIDGGSAYGAGRIEGIDGIGSVEVKGDIDAGTAQYAGSVYSTGSIKSLAVGGSLLGGNDLGSGSIFADKKIGNALVHGDLEGGAGEGSGYLQAQKSISKLTLEGDLVGGAGLRSGSVATFDGKIGKIDHDGNAVAGTGISSGKVIDFANKGVKNTHSSGSGTVNLNGGTFHAGSPAEGTGSTSGLILSGIDASWGFYEGTLTALTPVFVDTNPIYVTEGSLTWVGLDDILTIGSLTLTGVEALSEVAKIA